MREWEDLQHAAGYGRGMNTHSGGQETRCRSNVPTRRPHRAGLNSTAGVSPSLNVRFMHRNRGTNVRAVSNYTCMLTYCTVGPSDSWMRRPFVPQCAQTFILQRGRKKFFRPPQAGSIHPIQVVPLARATATTGFFGAARRRELIASRGCHTCSLEPGIVRKLAR